MTYYDEFRGTNESLLVYITLYCNIWKQHQTPNKSYETVP